LEPDPSFVYWSAFDERPTINHLPAKGSLERVLTLARRQDQALGSVNAHWSAIKAPNDQPEQSLVHRPP
jgi:hypothetical protein